MHLPQLDPAESKNLFAQHEQQVMDPEEGIMVNKKGREMPMIV